MNEPWNHYANERGQTRKAIYDTKPIVPYLCTNAYSEQANLWRQKVNLMAAYRYSGSEEGSDLMGIGFFFVCNGNILKLEHGDYMTVYTKDHRKQEWILWYVHSNSVKQTLKCKLLEIKIFSLKDIQL